VEMKSNVLSVKDEELQATLVHVYPNPTRQDFTLQVPSLKSTAGNVGLHLYNTAGQLVVSRQVPAEQVRTGISFSTQGLGKGIYHLQLTDKSKTYRRKLVVE